MSTVPYDRPFTVLAPAKVNIRLKIAGRRPDGYHELVSIMVPVALYDQLELILMEEPEIRMDCRGFSAPASADNLAWRAAQAFFSRIGFRNGLSMTLTKKIPVAAGLGGGSSDAAATLMALNEIFSEPIPPKELAGLALKLGADVPFFLQRSPCIAHGVGEILEPLFKWPPLSFVIVMPDVSVSTAWAYEALDRSSFNFPEADKLELELTTDDFYYMIRNLEKMPLEVCRLLENDLERVTVARFPVIAQIKQSLVHAGAAGALMSGSGPSVLGVFESETMAVRAKSILDTASLGRVFVVEGIKSWGVVKW